MVRTEGKVILVPENEQPTVVQIELTIKVERANYLRRNIFTALFMLVVFILLNSNVPIWLHILIALGGLAAIILLYEIYIGIQKRSSIARLDVYLASVAFDLFGVHYAPEMLQTKAKRKQKA